MTEELDDDGAGIHQVTRAQDTINYFDEQIPKDWAARWPDFEPWEIFSPDTSGTVDYKSWVVHHKEIPWNTYRDLHLMDLLFLDRIQALREVLGFPLIINNPSAGLTLRGFRSVEEQKIVVDQWGGAARSMHTQFRAVDVTPVGCPLQQVVNLARGMGFGGIGIYPNKNFVHLDTRALVVGQKPVEWEVF